MRTNIVQLTLAFNVGDGLFEFFDIKPQIDESANRVRVKTIRHIRSQKATDDSTAICDCPVARFGSVSDSIMPECHHMGFMESKIDRCCHGSASSPVSIDFTVDWADSDARFKYVAVIAHEHNDASLTISETHNISKKTFSIVDPQIDDLHAHQLLDLLVAGAAIDTPKASTASFNPRRIYREIVESINMQDELNSEQVLETSKSISLVEGFEFDSPFDKELTSGDYIHTKDRESTSDWRGIPRPDPTQFWVEQSVWDQGLRALAKGKNVCFTGPSGCGKTELVHLMAKAIGRDTESINCGATTEPRDVFVGTVEFDPDKGTHLSRSRFANFVGNDEGVMLLDEITRGTRDANNILLPLLDRQAYIALDEERGGEVIRRGENMAFAATANVGMEYTGTEALDIALKQRFAITIDLYFPPFDKEISLLVGRTGVGAEDAKRLCELAFQQREAKKLGDFVEEISTRMLLEAAELLVDGFDFLESCRYTILNVFSNDGQESSERARVTQMIQKRMA